MSSRGGSAVTINEAHNQVYPLPGGSSGSATNLDASSANLGASMADLARKMEHKRLKEQQEEQAELDVLLKAPPKPEYEPVKVFHLNKWTRRFALVIFLSSVLCAFVPQFIVYVAKNSHTFGLATECEGMACLPANFSWLRAHPSCKADCNSDGNFRARFSAVSGMLWLSVAFAALLAVVQYLHYGRKYIVPLSGIFFPTLALSIVGLGTYITALAVFGSTLDVGYENSDCAQSAGCLVYAGSSYVAVFGVILLFLGGICGLIACMFHRHRLGIKSAFFEALVQGVVNKESEDELASTRSLAYRAGMPPATAGNGGDGNNTRTAAEDSGANHAPDAPPPQTRASTGLPQPGDDSNGAATSGVSVDSAAGMVTQESRNFAAKKTGDFGSSDDDDDDDDDEEDEKAAEGANDNAPLTNIGEAADPNNTTNSNSNNNNSSSSSGKKKKKAKKNPILKEVSVSVRSSRSWQRLCNQLSIVCAGLAALFALGSVNGPKWVAVSLPNTSKLGAYSIGLIAECKDLSCSRLDGPAYDRLLVNNTCGNTQTELEARLGFSSLFYLVCAALTVPMYLTASKTIECIQGPTKRKVLTFLVWLMSFFATVLVMQTLDSWVNCDVPWCEAYLAANPTGASCEYGFQFGMALVSVCAATLLGAMNVVQACCRPCGYPIEKTVAELLAEQEGTVAAGMGLRALTAAVEDANAQQQKRQQQEDDGIGAPAPMTLDPAGHADDDDDDGSAPPPSNAHGETPMGAHDGNNYGPGGRPSAQPSVVTVG